MRFHAFRSQLVKLGYCYTFDREKDANFAIHGAG